MNKIEQSKKIWNDLYQKWTTLGDISKVEFTILSDPKDESRELAIDVAQNINGEWIVQTVQQQIGEAYSVIGIDGLTLDQLENLAVHITNSINCDEMHLFLKRISPATSEVYGYAITKKDEKIGIRTNYQHYYVLNEILEQRSMIMNEEYSEVQLHRKKDNGKVCFQFVFA